MNLTLWAIGERECVCEGGGGKELQGEGEEGREEAGEEIRKGKSDKKIQ